MRALLNMISISCVRCTCLNNWDLQFEFELLFILCILNIKLQISKTFKYIKLLNFVLMLLLGLLLLLLYSSEMRKNTYRHVYNHTNIQNACQ